MILFTLNLIGFLLNAVMLVYYLKKNNAIFSALHAVCTVVCFFGAIVAVR